MADLVRFKDEVASIIGGVAKTVMTQIFTAFSLKKPNPETEEQLGALLDRLCVEAVDRILKVIELTEDQTVENLKEVLPCDQARGGGGGGGGRGGGGGGDCMLKIRSLSSDEKLPPSLQIYLEVAGDGGGVHRSEPTCVLDAADAGCFLLPLPGSTHKASSANKAKGETKSSSSPPPPPPDDHEYARPPFTPPEKGAGRKQLPPWKRPGPVTAEPHLQCSQCTMLFPNAERLADHQKKSHPACSVCGSQFAGILKLREHEIREHGLLPYACDYCPKRFNHKAHRDLHVKARHTGEKTCHCDICGKGYSCISVLKTHRMTHFDKTFICSVCGKGFYHACHLTRHRLVHQDVRPHRCSTCGKSFTQAANLRSHQAVHAGERQLCSVCGKSFRCLKNHVISKHSHELPAAELPAADAIISCEVCGKKFPNASQYRLHRRSHTGEKPFHCDVCGKSYRTKDLLRDHRYTHTGEKPYRCSLCSKTFNLATSFTRHRSIHTGETPFSCHDCGKHFRLLTFLKAHLQTKAHLKVAQQSQADL